MSEIDEVEDGEFIEGVSPSAEESIREVIDDEEGGGDLMNFLGSGGIKQMLLNESYHDPERGVSYSQADLVADIVNVMRMDLKQMGAIHGVDIEVDKMSPERAAELLESLAKNEGVGIIEVFQKIEEKRDRIFEQEMTQEQYDTYQKFKRNMLYSMNK